MKRLLPIIILAVVAAMFVAPASALATKSCSASGQGGENAPDVAGPPDNSVNEVGAQGYKCTVAWDADIQPQYESGGTWHNATEIPVGFHPNTPDQFWPANTAYNWSGTFNAEGDSDRAFFPTASNDTPPCAFNWRLQVNFFDATHFTFAADVSPQTNKTC